MVRKVKFKPTLIASIVILMSSEMVSAADSSNTTFVPSSAPVTVTANQPFLLETGTNTKPTICSTAGCFTDAVVGQGYFATVKRCPTGFTPIVTLSTYKAQSSEGSGIGSGGSNLKGFAAACVYGAPVNESGVACGNSWIHEGTGTSTAQCYRVNFISSAFLNNNAGTSSSSVTSSNLGFNYELYCYPNNYFVSGTSTPISTIQVPDSTCKQFTDVTFDKEPLLWDTGYTDCQSFGEYNCYIYTAANKRCPISYTPVISTSVFKGALSTVYDSAGSIDSLNTVYACPYNNVFDENFFNLGSNSNYKIQLNFSNSTTGGNQPSLGNVGTSWSLYCYPPGATLPANDLNCGIPGSPVLTVKQPTMPQTWVFQFGQWGTANWLGGKVDTNSPDLYKNSYYTAQYWDSNSNGWSIPFANSNTTPADYILIPSNGTYKFTLNVNLVNINSDKSCMYFYLNYGDGSYLGFFTTKTLAGGASGNFNININANNIFQGSLIAFKTNVLDTFYLTAGTTVKVNGYLCISSSKINATSNGSLTVTRVGP